MKSILTLFLTLILSTMAWASPQPNRMQTTTVTFESGSSNLDSDQKEKIQKIIKELSVNAEEVDVDVAVWSDQPYPEGDKDLSSDQENLADERIKVLKNYIASTPYEVETESYNMAERNGWFAKLFDTDASEVKTVVSKSDVNEDALKEEYQAFKSEGGPKKAVLVFKRD